MIIRVFDGCTDRRTHARTDNGPWHKLDGLRPVELTIGILQETTFFHDRASNWKKKKPRKSTAVQYHILSFNQFGPWVVDGWTDGRTIVAATICSPFGEHKKLYSANTVFVRRRGLVIPGTAAQPMTALELIYLLVTFYVQIISKCLLRLGSFLAIYVDEPSKENNSFAHAIKCISLSCDGRGLTLTCDKFVKTYSRFVWANGRAAGIGRTIPVCSIGRLPLLEALPSLPLDIWKSRQSFRNKMAEAANETWVEEWFLLIWHLCLLSSSNLRVFTWW